MSVSWEALCEDIRRAQPPLLWELIREAHRYVEEMEDMAKGPKGGNGAHGKAGGADKGKSDIDRTGKFGKHHGGNLSGSAKSGKAGGGKAGGGKK